MKRMLAVLAVAVALTAPNLFGATLVPDENAELLTFQDRSVFIWTQKGELTVSEDCKVELLLVGGGGGGGAQDASEALRGGAGGGGGGVVHKEGYTLLAGTYQIDIGAGGAINSNGGDTTLKCVSTGIGLIAHGGGGGANPRGNAGNDGASGGGATAQSSEENSGGVALYVEQGELGNNGGNSAHQYGPGGGGGAGAPGSPNSGSSAGNGGDGLPFDICGTNVWYAGGGAGCRTNKLSVGGKGGGGGYIVNQGAQKGVDGLGGGGCGGCAGGSGTLIISYVRGAPGPDTEDFELRGGDRLIPLVEDSVLVYTNSGTLTVTGSGTVEILAVGGGGGGGAVHPSDSKRGGAGGGAGGFVHYTNITVTAGTYDVVIGEGGAIGANGGNTKGLGIVAYGGGYGGAGAGGPGGNGGSGGGSSATFTDQFALGEAIYGELGNVGHPGGKAIHPYGGAGGGGAGGSGEDYEGTGSDPGMGGVGLPCSITGAEEWYAGGGAGCRGDRQPPNGSKGGGGAGNVAGTPGTGGGGGANAAGGCGTFIVRYHKKSYTEVFEDGIGGVVNHRKGYMIHTFKEDGEFTLPHAGLVDILLVGGGGGGGLCSNPEDMQAADYGGGGGGAGGVVCLSNIVLAAGSHAVKIGQGGGVGATGGDSSVEGVNVLAYGGGGGAANRGGTLAQDGASGGGASCAPDKEDGDPIPGGSAVRGTQGHVGGSASNRYGPGGGGGAGSAGQDGYRLDTVSPGNGGDGVCLDFTGIPTWYAGGGCGYRNTKSAEGGKGGGGSHVAGQPGEKGDDGLGGGGCGGYAGGSGVVIIRYRRPPRGLAIILR